jgi:hypothetical protein
MVQEIRNVGAWSLISPTTAPPDPAGVAPPGGHPVQENVFDDLVPIDYDTLAAQKTNAA